MEAKMVPTWLQNGSQMAPTRHILQSALVLRYLCRHDMEAAWVDGMTENFDYLCIWDYSDFLMQ